MSIAKAIENCENIVLIVNGGIGRNIMATAVVRNIKKAYPDKDLIVVAGCPEIFLRNPNIKRVLRLGQCVYFYEDYILNSKSYVINIEPYQHFDYIYKEKHFVECWCEMIGVSCDNVYPEIFFNENEKRMAQIYLDKFDKPMVLIQHSGGIVPKDKSEQEQMTASSSMYRRNLTKEIAQKVADTLISQGFMIGSVQGDNQFCISMAEKIQFPIRAILALIPEVAGIVAIDSFLQHGCACFKRKALVLWGGTSPKVLGYDSNVNLIREVCKNPMCHRPNSYLFDIEPTGFIWDCPENNICMDYPAEEILNSFQKIVEEDEKNAGENPRRKRGVKNSKNGDKREEGKPEKDSIGAGEKVSPDSGTACPSGRDGEACPGNCDH